MLQHYRKEDISKILNSCTFHENRPMDSGERALSFFLVHEIITRELPKDIGFSVATAYGFVLGLGFRKSHIVS